MIQNKIEFSPVALFVFNRPEHTKRTLDSLSKNPEFDRSPLYVYCDGARNDSELIEVKETRDLIQEWDHPEKIIVERDKNMGLANSIISGVTYLCEKYGKVIVLEDDLVTSPFFLDYMNSALIKYQDENRVISIHGYSYPINNLPETFFIMGASCWGWATWARGWNLFDKNGKKLFKQLSEKKMMKRFDVNGAYPYRRMLLDQIHGNNDSWAIRWYASALINQKLTLHPGRSLVFNIGLDGTGSHCDPYNGFDTSLSTTSVELNELVISENAEVLSMWAKFLRSTRREKILKNIFSFRKLFDYFSRRLRY